MSDARAFGALLCTLADRRIALHFNGDRVTWDGDVDEATVRLIRRFRRALRAAYGDDRLPPPTSG